jgi:hypothetical protein
MTRINLRIDRVVSDRPGLDRAALEQALRLEIARTVAGQGIAALGRSRDRPLIRADLPRGNGPLAPRVAAAALKAVKP